MVQLNSSREMITVPPSPPTHRTVLLTVSNQYYGVSREHSAHGRYIELGDGANVVCYTRKPEGT